MENHDRYLQELGMTAVKTYRDLIAWQRGMDLACEVYRLTAEFPKEELYGLTRQVRAAAVSVPSNIGEGQARGQREFRHYMAIALGSLQELETQLLLAERLRFADRGDVTPVMELASEVGRLLHGLTRSLADDR
jgi:four helix bundle protein